MSLLALLALSALAAEPPPPEAPAETHRPAVHQRMAEHFLLTTTARAGVMRGDVEAVQEAGKRLAKLPIDDLPPTWRPQLEALAQVGRELASAPDLEQSGAAFARLAGACAECHATTGGGLKLPESAAPPPEWTEETHMARHLWAAEWIWLGMIANDDAAVLRGAQALSDGPITRPSPTRDPEITEREQAVHATATAMVDAPDLGSRRALYGQLITECGVCHRALEAEGRTP